MTFALNYLIPFFFLIIILTITFKILGGWGGGLNLTLGGGGVQIVPQYQIELAMR